MKITAIKQQTKNPQRASIFVDDRYGFSLTLDELLDQRLKVGEEISPPQLNKLKKISQDGKLRARALEWVLMRPRSHREFSDYLRRKKVEAEVIGRLDEEFAARNYLDDKSFARWLVELRTMSGKSNRAIQAELFKKGVHQEVVDEVMGDNGNSEDDRIKQIIAKKSKLTRYQANPQKLAQYLARQGFSYDLIKRHLSSKGDVLD